MIIDARQMTAAAVVDADVCIVGGGAAGITAALEFVGGPLRVVLLEAGGLKSDPASQALYRGESIGLPYEDLDAARVRYLGGSTNREGWGGWCKPLHHLDFEKRDWVPHSGWPITLADLDPYYDRAQRICELGPYDYDLESWEEHLGDGALAALPIRGRILTEIQQMSPPTRFGKTYRDALQRSQNVEVHLHANAVEVETSDNGALATAVRVVTLTGIEYRVEAGTFVLATGGIENARLLLASNGVEAAGVGNRNDLVGRFFMDHIRVDIGELVLNDPSVSTDLYDPAVTFGRRSRAVTGTYDPRIVSGALTLSPETLRSEGLLGYRAWLVAHHTDYESRGVRALRQFYLAMRDRELPPRPAGLAADVIKDVRRSSAALFRHLLKSKRRRDRRFLVNIVEPEPDPDSRVTISRSRDILGVPEVRVDWRVGSNVSRTLDRAHRIIDSELAAAGIGHLEHAYSDQGGAPQPLRWVWHHMGTTRMDDDPRRGVVDSDCRVHGIANLFVAGSSVFPSCGNDMPTLTIVALALRLADRLKRVAG